MEKKYKSIGSIKRTADLPTYMKTININQGTIGCTPNVRVLPWYLLCSLGIIGDEKTHEYPLSRAYIGISYKGTLGPGYIQLSPD